MMRRVASATVGGSVIDKDIAASNFDENSDMEIALVRTKVAGDDFRLMIYDAPYTLGKTIGAPIAKDNNIGWGSRLLRHAQDKSVASHPSRWEAIDPANMRISKNSLGW